MAAPVLPEDISRKLLEDPAVQQSIQDTCSKTNRDAADALLNEEVQSSILKACEERFPDWAAPLKARMKEWIEDPQVGNTSRLATEWTIGLHQGEMDIVTLARVQQGPPTIRMICVGGCFVAIVHCLIGLGDLSSLLRDPVSYAVTLYQLIFSSAALLFEVRAEMIQAVGLLDSSQNYLLEKAQFLAENLGRGIFYIFQATLWISFLGKTDSMGGFCFLYSLVTGILLIGVRLTKTTVLTNKVTTVYRPVAKEVLP